MDASYLTTEQYHQLSDATMDILLESLEELLDTLGHSDYEVEYHVHCYVSMSSQILITLHRVVS